MIEETLVQYGVLGLWTASLMWEKYKTTNKMLGLLGRIEKKIERM